MAEHDTNNLVTYIKKHYSKYEQDVFATIQEGGLLFQWISWNLLAQHIEAMLDQQPIEELCRWLVLIPNETNRIARRNMAYNQKILRHVGNIPEGIKQGKGWYESPERAELVILEDHQKVQFKAVGKSEEKEKILQKIQEMIQKKQKHSIAAD